MIIFGLPGYFMGVWIYPISLKGVNLHITGAYHIIPTLDVFLVDRWFNTSLIVFYLKLATLKT